MRELALGCFEDICWIWIYCIFVLASMTGRSAYLLENTILFFTARIAIVLCFLSHGIVWAESCVVVVFVDVEKGCDELICELYKVSRSIYSCETDPT